jgi:hypothetical protein
MKKGDLVVVCMARNDCFTFQKSCRFSAYIKEVPGFYEVGDLTWTLDVDGNEVMLNPTSKDFIGMELRRQ